MQGCRLLGIVVVLALGSGCQIGRKTFQIDSNSQTPFFGIDLLGDKSAPDAKSNLAAARREAKVVAVKDAPPAVAARKDASLLEKLGLKKSQEWIPLTLSAPESAENSPSN